MPSIERYTAAYFFRLLQIGKKNKTSNALGRKIAIIPIRHPSICISAPISFSAIPPVKEEMEKTGPGIALTIPMAVYISFSFI